MKSNGEKYKDRQERYPHKFQLAVIGNPFRVSGWRLTSKGWSACSLGSTGVGFCEWPLLWKRQMELSARFPSHKHTAIYFPPPAKAGGSPFLSRTGNVLHAFHLSAFACFPFYKRTFQYLTISPWHMFVYKGRQKHVSFCHKSKQFRFLAKEILALRFPSLERGGMMTIACRHWL